MRFIGYTGVVCVLLIAAAATGAVGAAVERTAPDQLREYVRHATELAEATPAQPWPEDVPKPAHIVENEAGLTDDVVVSTKNGQVKGYTSFGTTYFHSIPFAAPPLADLRFRSAQPAQSWSGVKDTTSMPPICPQLKILNGIYMGHEDCLYLHVTIPEHDPAVKLPVLFWIFGGGWVLGDGYEFGFYDATKLAAERNVIVVQPNYRLAALGFLTTDELRQEDPRGSTGNMALSDQTMALQWVQDNIAAFGGDPSRVAIFGESAGGFSVCWHLASPDSKGLFTAAIIESGSCDSIQFFQKPEISTPFGYTFAASIGCNATGTELLTCLRSLDTNQIVKSLLDMLNPDWPFNTTADLSHVGAMTDGLRSLGVPEQVLGQALLPPFAPFMAWGATIDGVALPDLPYELLKRGEFQKVPIIDEGMLFVPSFPIVVKNTTFPPDDDSLLKIIKQLISTRKMNSTTTNMVAQEVLNHYPLDSYDGNTWKRAAAVLTHYFFRCGTRRSARAIAEHHEDIYLYLFNFPLTWIDYQLLGDYHTVELPYVYSNAWPPILHPLSRDSDKKLAAAMGTFWSNMAVLGTPNDNTVPLQWPRYNASADLSIQLNWPLETQQGLQEGLCDFWDTIEKIVIGPN